MPPFQHPILAYQASPCKIAFIITFYVIDDAHAAGMFVLFSHPTYHLSFFPQLIPLGNSTPGSHNGSTVYAFVSVEGYFSISSRRGVALNCA